MVNDMKIGDKFKVVKNGIVGTIVGGSDPVFHVSFIKPDGSWYYNADVHYTTIANNLKYGFYERM